MNGDTYNHADRAGFLERLGRLAGQTTFRMPSAGGTPYSARMMTTENALALALSFARRGPNDIGPEIAYSIGTGIPDHPDRVMLWLDGKFQRDAGYDGRRLQMKRILSRHCYELVAFGVPISRIPRESRLPASWVTLRNIGVGWLWMRAESTIERAEYVLHAAVTHKRHQTALDTENVGATV